MSRLLKWVLVALAALGLLGVVVAIAVYTLVDPQQYRTMAIDAVQRTTGRTLTLDGEIGLKLFPCCAVQVDTATLGNPAGFAGEPFLRVGSAQLAIRLWPLLTRREVEIGTVQLDGLQVNLLGRADGSNNWTFTGPAEAEPTPPADSGNAGLGSFSVAGVRISNGTLNYQDEADNSRYRIEGLDLKTGPIANAAPFDLDAALTGHDLSDNSGGKLNLKARITLTTDADATSVTLADLQADVDLRGIAGLESLYGKLGSPALTVRLADNTRVTAAELGTDLKLTTAELPDQTIPLKAALTGLRYDVDVDGGTLGGLTATANVAGVELKINVDQPATFGAHNNLRGILQFAEVSPRDVLARLKEPVPVTADSNVLKRLSGKGQWFVTDTDIGIEKLALVLDDSRISGAVSRQILAEGSKAVPRTRFDLSVDAINADRYLEPASEAAEKPGTSAGQPAADAAGSSPTEIPVESIRGLNLDGRARIGKLTIDGMQLAGVDVQTTASGGRLSLNPLSANLYGGSLKGNLSIDASGARPRVALDQTLTGIDVEPLLAAFADMRNISGKMSVKLAAAGTGRTDDEVISNLAGNLSFKLADGVYKGMDVWYEIRKARALIRRIEPPVLITPEQTPINALDMSGKISDGVLRTDQLLVEIPFLRVSGKADVNLPKKSLNSELTALVFEKPVFADDTSLEDLVNARIPLTIKGPLDDPKVRVDLQKMVQGALKESVREVIREKLGDQLREKLGLGTPAAPAGEPATEGGAGEAPANPDQQAPKKDDAVKKALDKLLGR